MSDQKVVLVVDDDPSILRGIQRLLRNSGVETILFGSAAELRGYSNFERACCVVIDINLKEESGIELRQQLKTAGVKLPVIFITGNDDKTTREAAIKSECLAYLVKPFTGDELVNSLRIALDSSEQVTG